MKQITFYSLMACVMAFGLASCGGNQTKEEEGYNIDTVAVETETAAVETETAAVESEQPKILWQYGQAVDDLTNDVTAVNAYLTSNNKVVYDSNGNEAKLVIYLRYSEFVGKLINSVSFILDSSGKYLTCQYARKNSSGIRAVFDDGDVDDTWSIFPSAHMATPLSDDRTSITMFGYMSAKEKVNGFIEKLKQSKTCKIQVHLDDLGMKTFEFNCGGLEWDYE